MKNNFDRQGGSHVARIGCTRVARRAIVLLVLGGMSAFPARAQEKLAAFLPATPGAKLCFARSYDAAHLCAHPKQRVTALTFMLRVVGIDDGGDWVLTPAGKYDRVSYQFALRAARRGERKQLSTSGYCPPEGKDVRCIRECDGGGVTLEKSGDALMLRLDADGIRMDGCDEEKSKWLKAGADDKSFRIEKVAIAQCAALEKAELGK